MFDGGSLIWMVFWRNRETVKPLSLRRLPLDLKASPKLTDRSWPQSEKKGKMRKSMVSWNIPPNDDIMINEGFKGKIDQTKWPIFETMFTKGFFFAVLSA